MSTTVYSFVCAFCGNAFSKTGHKYAQFCSRNCMGKFMEGRAHPGGVKSGVEASNWKGGRQVRTRGYVTLWTGKNANKLEHHIVAERALGHALPLGTVVHHVDENTSNNAPGNLVICQDDRYHKLLHARKRRLDDTGSLDLKRCSRCGFVKPLSEFATNPNQWDKHRAYCKPCGVADVDDYRQRRRVQRLSAFII